MKRITWAMLLGVVGVGLLSQYARTQGCTPGYSPGSATIGNIQTLCMEEYPTPQTRTDVGIGEQVTCSIDPNTWLAYAIYTDQYCNQSSVNDPLDSITWSVSGQGSVYPTTGDSTTLTIDLADEDNVVTVYATATDSLLVDAPVQKAQAMNAKVPTGVTPVLTTDNPPAAWVQGNNNLGAQTAFLFQIQPNTVNFGNMNFKVEYSGSLKFAWPNGQKAPVAPSTWGAWMPQNVGATVNLQTRTVTQNLVPIGVLAGGNYNWTNAGTLQFKGANWGGLGDFSSFYNYRGVKNPMPPPAVPQQNQTIVGNNMTINGNSDTPWGGWQGPWQ